MLDSFPLYATVAASDMDRARAWYSEKLGLTPKDESMGTISYEFKGGTGLLVYPSEHAGTAKNTQVTITVEGIESLMEELRGRGVVFEEYDFGEVKTVDGLMTIRDVKSAWFTDSEGNIFALVESRS